MKNYRIAYLLIIFLIAALGGCQKSDEVVPVVDLNISGAGNDPGSLRGFDEWGYNWHAHQFIGRVFNAIVGDYLYQDMPFYKIDPYTGDDEAYLNKYPWAETLPFWQYRNMNLVMHWNEALISSEGVYQEWMDSDAWITFHYQLGSGKDKWSEFQKFVAVKSTDYLDEGKWYSESGELIGLASEWDELALIQLHDTGMPPLFMSPTGVGLGKYKIKP